MAITEEKAQWLYKQPDEYKYKNPTRYARALEKLGKTEELGNYLDEYGNQSAQARKSQKGQLKSFKRKLQATTPSAKQERIGAKNFIGSSFNPRTGQNYISNIWNKRKNSLVNAINAEKEKLAMDINARTAEETAMTNAYNRLLTKESADREAKYQALQQAATNAQLTGQYVTPGLNEEEARAKAFSDYESELGRKVQGAGELGEVAKRTAALQQSSSTPTLDYLSTMAALNQNGGGGRSGGGGGRRSGGGKAVSDISPGMLSLAQSYLDGTADISGLSHDLQPEFWNAVALLQSTNDTTDVTDETQNTNDTTDVTDETQNTNENIAPSWKLAKKYRQKIPVQYLGESIKESPGKVIDWIGSLFGK